MSQRRSRVKPTPDGQKKTYILVMKDESRQKLTIPSHWTLTFGPIFPGSKTETAHAGGVALRLYEGDAQRAVFTGVQAFRDSSIEIEVEVTRAQDHGVKVATSVGEKQVVVRAEVKEWVNPDDPQTAAQDYKLLQTTVLPEDLPTPAQPTRRK